MVTLLRYLLYLHVLAGFIGFLVAPVALAVQKGSPAHRAWGKVFFWSMLVAATSSLGLASLKPLYVPLPAGRVEALRFLFLTGLFTLYLAGFGYRALYLKKLGRGQRPAWTDWLTAGLGLPVFGFFVYYGWQHSTIPALVFGGIGVMITSRQLLSYLRRTPPDPQRWLHNHIRGFVGAYIAAVSAFSANVLTFLPWPWNFLWPTLLGVPYLLWAQRHYASARREPAAPSREVRAA